MKAIETLKRCIARKKAIETLKRCIAESDREVAHVDADDALCELLAALGHQDVVELYHKVRKWFA